MGQHRVGLLWYLDIGHKTYELAVAGLRRELIQGQQLGFTSMPLAIGREIPALRLLVGLDDDDALIAVDDHVVAGAHLFGDIRETEDRRDFKRPRKDSGVRCLAAFVHGDCSHHRLSHTQSV